MANVLITGSTGMVGKGVLLECLDHPRIDQVLVLNRSTLGMQHPKLREVLLADFLQVDGIREHLRGYDACFFCMGVSSVGMSEEQYSRITYDATKAFADVLFELNPEMVFIYVSGTGTDSTESGRSMWARVKGRTENMVFAKGFRDAYAFRPGLILPERNIRSRTGWYNAIYTVLRPFFPLFRNSRNVTTTSKVGLAMINTLFYPTEKKVLENADINQLAAQVPG